MKNFYKEIENICRNKKRVAMFVDMDGTIVEYKVYPKGEITNSTKGKFNNEKPVVPIVEELEIISKIENLDIYILTLAKSNIIVQEKKEWLRKNISFIKPEMWIIINKEKGQYTKETRNYIKAEKMKQKLGFYDHVILLDDEHEILKSTQEILKDKCNVYHISSVIV